MLDMLIPLRGSWLHLQEEEKAEREAKKRAKAERKRAEKAPGFDGRWYTDMEAHVR